MARPLSVKLERTEERQALAEMALREYREPADQAAYLIVEGLRHAGFLTDRPAPTDRQPDTARMSAPADVQAPYRDELEQLGKDLARLLADLWQRRQSAASTAAQRRQRPPRSPGAARGLNSHTRARGFGGRR